jgi:hypothetical protein
MSIEQLIDPFYKELPANTFRKEPSIGQLCWIPTLHINKIPLVMEVERADPKEAYATKFKVRNLTESDFKQRAKLPIKSLNLRETEELIVNKAKKRPAIIICTSPTIFDDLSKVLRKLGRLHLQEECLFFAPIYNIETAAHRGGFPPIMVSRIKALMYSQFFYCPLLRKEGLSGGIARLDRLQMLLPINRAVYDPLPISLSDDALAVLLAMMRFLFGSAEEELIAYKEVLMDTLPPEAKPPSPN